MKDHPSRQVLDEAPSRVLTFLIGVGESPPIRAALVSRGYSQSEHDYAWSRLQSLGSLPPSAATIDVEVRSAVVAIDAWDEPNFACIEAALDRLHPAQSAFLFEGIRPSQGPESVIGVGILLDRLDALESSPARLPTRAQDHAALATLTARGYTPAERARLRGLVTLAQRGAGSAPITDDQRTQTLVDLYAWFNDWATTARAVITRRDQLIRLGLAKRRKRQEGEAPADEASADEGSAPPATTTPATTTPATTTPANGTP